MLLENTKKFVRSLFLVFTVRRSPMEVFNHLKKAYENNENVRNLCEEVGITRDAVQGAPFTRPWGMM